MCDCNFGGPEAGHCSHLRDCGMHSSCLLPPQPNRNGLIDLLSAIRPIEWRFQVWQVKFQTLNGLRLGMMLASKSADKTGRALHIVLQHSL